MYDGPQYDYDEIDALPMGPRLYGNGERRPSLILDAIRMDLQWTIDTSLEGGGDYEGAQRVLLFADALLAYVRTSSHLDVGLPVGDDEMQNYIDETDRENHAIFEAIEWLINMLEPLPLFTVYGWAAEDRQTDGFDELGVWINWPEINRNLEKGDMISVSHEAELDDIDFVAAAMEQGAAYALIDDGASRIGIYRLGETCTQEWLRE